MSDVQLVRFRKVNKLYSCSTPGRTNINCKRYYPQGKAQIFNLLCSEYGPPYLDFPRSILEGMSSSQYVRALRLRGALCLAAKLTT